MLGSNTKKPTEDLRKLHNELLNFNLSYNHYGGWSVSEKFNMDSTLTRLVSGKRYCRSSRNRMQSILFSILRISVNGGFF
jgi:hypothetical protein